jgi:hypothetical protein
MSLEGITPDTPKHLPRKKKRINCGVYLGVFFTADFPFWKLSIPSFVGSLSWHMF